MNTSDTIITTCNGVPVTENEMKLIQGYLMAMLTSDEVNMDYFDKRIHKVSIDRFVMRTPTAAFSK